MNINDGTPADQCTDASFFGCERRGDEMNTINPIKSARLRTVNSFAFKYGRVEIIAKTPVGDWLWPAVWLLPKHDVYGKWPASGEIDILEVRGNRDLKLNGVNIGVQQQRNSLHFGPYSNLNSYHDATFVTNNEEGYHTRYHKYELEWTSNYIKFFLDGVQVGQRDGDFWHLGNFDKRVPGTDNPWRHGTKMAPFDEEFYLVINLAVGGNAYFPDAAVNKNGKPWKNQSPSPSTDFWKHRNTWLPTWNLDENYSSDASLKVDSIKIWAL